MLLTLILVAFLFYFLGWIRSKHDSEYQARKREQEKKL